MSLLDSLHALKMVSKEEYDRLSERDKQFRRSCNIKGFEVGSLEDFLTSYIVGAVNDKEQEMIKCGKINGYYVELELGENELFLTYTLVSNKK